MTFTRQLTPPPKDKLLVMRKTMSYRKMGKELGVSHHTAKKWCIDCGINIPTARTNSHLEPSDIPLIRALVADGMPLKEVGEKFEVGIKSVSRIANYSTWKHIR